MFKHIGKSRTAAHNLGIASLLSFVAGIVNVAGFLSIQKLTTNVTGHFAFFVDEVFKMHFWQGLIYFLYIFFFFFGSFVSSFIIELITKKNENYRYIVPTTIEILILFLVASFGQLLIINNPNLLAFSLLFAMGMQNALVTSISNARVRTTHLTGLFTDLGIELSQLFFYREIKERAQLLSSIRLRFTIISFFFIGGLLGGVFYERIELHVLYFAVVTLIIGLIFDRIKLRILQLNRKMT